MKKFIPVVILAAGAQVGCERSGSCSAAYAAYQEFGKAVANERWDEAERMAASPDVSDWISARRRAVVFRGYKTLPSCRGMLHWGPVFKLVSETYLDGGARAILQVIQEERSGVYTRDPTGPPTARRNQTAVLSKVGAEWKITAFDEEVSFLDPQ
ncbi:MAG TPA: hypothetical protein PKX48_04005 [Planctomycetota bacterium]|jgi:hypothetical protein|nr:hypothetical protein [Planctomycetota bacterium]OQC21390.1 MAG: hypothetical protein BWX69_00875 [Planctomycetes bacterium ADurb.Bin069]HNR97849.1 hypothetical protein [Planctomycetota bacterium]HNU24684.1 hypothetical protein [Planctomycetota bacterium]HOE29886.1 hypothetical protein [Planctomycetota bacterium]